jgi:hypothetical protein
VVRRSAWGFGKERGREKRRTRRSWKRWKRWCVSWCSSWLVQRVY